MIHFSGNSQFGKSTFSQLYLQTMIKHAENQQQHHSGYDIFTLVDPHSSETQLKTIEETIKAFEQQLANLPTGEMFIKPINPLSQ